MQIQKTILLSQFQPQNNLPKYNIYSSNELKLFNSFVKKLKSEIKFKNVIHYTLGSELNLNGYGIADLALLEYWPVKKKKMISQKKILTVFELKIKDWRKALKQAYRYKYYSHKSIVVMPDHNADRAILNLDIFRALGVGLWVYNNKNNSLRKIYSPRIQRPFSKFAFKKAHSLLMNKSKFPQSF